MTHSVQQLVALGLVALAASYVVRVLWKAVRGNRRGGCGSCGSCGTDKHVVTIDALKRTG